MRRQFKVQPEEMKHDRVVQELEEHSERGHADSYIETEQIVMRGNVLIGFLS